MPRETRLLRSFKWFQLWIQEGYTVKQIAALSGRSPSGIRHMIHHWLSQNPPRDEAQWRMRLSQCHHIIADGTIFRRKSSEAIYAVMDSVNHELIYGGYGIREGAKDLQQVYAMLANTGLHPDSATIDGNPQQAKYLSLQWPRVRLQRCVVHVQRQGLRWCRRNPKRTDAKHLRKLFLELTTIKTTGHHERFVRAVHRWDQRFGHSIRKARRTTGGWVFSDLALAARMIVRSLPDLFHFVDGPNIASSTNPLEGYFSRLKEKYRRHRGLAPKYRERYFQWFFYFQPR